MAVNITNVLHENGYEVILCATRKGGPLEKFINPDVRYYVLNKKHFADITAFRKLLHIIKHNNVELIHAHSSSLFWALAVKFLKRKIKVIWHDHLGARINNKKKNFFYKIFSIGINAIISVNEELFLWARKNMKVPAERVFMINNFPLLKNVHRQPDPDRFTIVCLANIRPQKDHSTLIKAVGILAGREVPKKLRVILAGSYTEDEYFNGLRSLVNDLGLREIIEFRGSVEDTASLLASADCGVLSSVSEGLPVSLLEYGMAGLPVVVTDAGQCAGVVEYGKYGKVVPVKDPDAMAEALKWIIENKKHADEMGESFREHVINEYGAGKFMENYNYLLSKLFVND